MKQLLIIYHTQSGNTERLAQAVAGGSSGIEGIETVLLRAADAGLDDLLACSGLIIGSPEYFGYMAGAVKDFFDRTYERTHKDPRMLRKPYTAFIHAGNAGAGALSSIERICLGYKLKKVYQPLVVTGAISGEVLSRCADMGQTMAAGCAEGIY